MGNRETCQSVSYTHLDVYKRQHQISRYWAILSSIPIMDNRYFRNKMRQTLAQSTVLLNDARTVSVPVSYTHLDVYKRQAYTQRIYEGSPLKVH